MIRVPETRAMRRAQAAFDAFFNLPLPLHTDAGLRLAVHLGAMLEENARLRATALKLAATLEEERADRKTQRGLILSVLGGGS